MVVQYLEACQSLFEFGILSHNKIKDNNSAVLNHMRDGIMFFMGWANICYIEGMNTIFIFYIFALLLHLSCCNMSVITIIV